MSFNSTTFLLFLPIVVALFYLFPRNYRWVVLLVASYWFYMSWKWQYGFLLLATTAIDYFAALQMDRHAERRKRLPFLLLSLVTNLGVLAFFKYAGFFAEVLTDPRNLFDGGDVAFKVLLPIGISFYVFQTLSYTIDVYRGTSTAQRNFGKLALFVSFFPHLDAGPIVRYNILMPQLDDASRLKFDADKWRTGIQLVIWGYFKKLCVADRIAELIDPVFANPTSYPAVIYLLSGFFFLVQIYADFSGYTDIATGVARLFGVELSINWRHPLLAVSNRDFWRKWNITITSWFRDYVYISLGGNRQRLAGMLLSVFAVFTLSGLWHGANITFIAWGMLNGLLVVIEIVLSRTKIGFARLRPLGWVYLVISQSLLFVIFRAESGADAVHMLDAVFSPEVLQARLDVAVEATFPIFSLLLTLFSMALLIGKELWEISDRGNVRWGPARPLFYVVIVWIIFTIGNFSTDEFIYFQF